MAPQTMCASIEEASEVKMEIPSFKQARLIVFLLVVYLVVGLIPLYLLFSLSIEALNRETGMRLQVAASLGSAMIDGDLHAKIRKAEDVNSEAYKKVKSQLRRLLKAASDVQVVHIYTLRKNPDQSDLRKGTFFVVDSAELGDFSFLNEKDIAQFGNPYCLGPGMKKAFTGVASSTSFIYGNKCGNWRTGYAPIRKSNGEIDAILCVDGSASDTLEQMQRLYAWGRFSIILSMVFMVALVLILGIRSTRSMEIVSDEEKL